MKEKQKEQDSWTKYQEALRKLEDSGLTVIDRTKQDSLFGFIGGIRRLSSISAQDDDDGGSATKPAH